MYFFSSSAVLYSFRAVSNCNNQGGSYITVYLLSDYKIFNNAGRDRGAAVSCLKEKPSMVPQAEQQTTAQ